MSFLAILFAGSLSASAQGNACPEQVSTATLAQHISAADLAFSSMDENAFRTARWSAQRSLRCMGEAIQTGQAAAYYRMEALGSFLDQNHAQTVGFFKSMLKVAPTTSCPIPWRQRVILSGSISRWHRARSTSQVTRFRLRRMA